LTAKKASERQAETKQTNRQECTQRREKAKLERGSTAEHASEKKEQKAGTCEKRVTKLRDQRTKSGIDNESAQGRP